MTDTDKLVITSKIPVMTIRANYAAWIIGFSMVCLMTVGITGVFWGKIQTEKKTAAEIAMLKTDNRNQAITYEQRLGTQSAAYARESALHLQSLTALTNAIGRVSTQQDKYARERKHALDEAVQTARDAAQTAQEQNVKITQLLRAQQETKVAATVAASAAKETQKTLEQATLPAAVVPAKPWGK